MTDDLPFGTNFDMRILMKVGSTIDFSLRSGVADDGM